MAPTVFQPPPTEDRPGLQQALTCIISFNPLRHLYQDCENYPHISDEESEVKQLVQSPSEEWSWNQAIRHAILTHLPPTTSLPTPRQPQFILFKLGQYTGARHQWQSVFLNWMSLRYKEKGEKSKISFPGPHFPASRAPARDPRPQEDIWTGKQLDITAALAPETHIISAQGTYF